MGFRNMMFEAIDGLDERTFNAQEYTIDQVKRSFDESKDEIDKADIDISIAELKWIEKNYPDIYDEFQDSLQYIRSGFGKGDYMPFLGTDYDPLKQSLADVEALLTQENRLIANREPVPTRGKEYKEISKSAAYATEKKGEKTLVKAPEGFKTIEADTNTFQLPEPIDGGLLFNSERFTQSISSFVENRGLQVLTLHDAYGKYQINFWKASDEMLQISISKNGDGGHSPSEKAALEDFVLEAKRAIYQTFKASKLNKIISNDFVFNEDDGYTADINLNAIRSIPEQINRGFEWRENPEFAKIVDQVDGNDFWNPEEIRVVKKGENTIVRIPVGAANDIQLIMDKSGDWTMKGFDDAKTQAIQGNMDDAFENAALVQRMLSEVAVGRWRLDDSMWKEEEPFTENYDQSIAFDSAGDSIIPWNVIDGVSIGAAAVSGIGLPYALVRLSQGGPVGIHSNEVIDGGDVVDDQVLALMNACYRKMNPTPYKGKAEIPAHAPEEIGEALHGDFGQMSLDWDGSNIWNKDRVDVKESEEDGVTKWTIDIPLEPLEKALYIKGQPGRWSLYAEGEKIDFGDDLQDAMDTAALIQNLSLEVVSGKYASEDDAPFDNMAGFITFDGMSAATAEIIFRGREIVDEETETVVKILNSLYGKLKHSRRDQIMEKVTEKVEEENKKALEAADAAGSSDTTTTTPPGGGGPKPGPSGSGGESLPGGGGAGSDLDTDDGGPSDGPAGGPKSGTDEKPDTGSTGGPGKDGSPDHEHDRDDKEAPEKPSDRGFMETHETLQLFNAMAQHAFGKDKDYRARIMRKLRKRKRGKIEGRERRTRFPVVRTTKFEVKDGQVTWKFKDSLKKDATEIKYKVGTPNKDPEGAKMVTEHGITFADTPANRRAIQEFFQGTIFKMKEKPVNENDIQDRKKEGGRALDSFDARSSMRRKWRTMKDEAERAAKETGKRVRVSFGWRRPYMVNKTVKIKVKGQPKKKLLVSLDYQDRDVTAKIKDEGGRLYENLGAAVKSVIGDPEQRRKRKARRKKKSVE